MRLKSTCKQRKGLELFASLLASQLSFQLSTFNSLSISCTFNKSTDYIQQNNITFNIIYHVQHSTFNTLISHSTNQYHVQQINITIHSTKRYNVQHNISRSTFNIQQINITFNKLISQSTN